jgi:hypothetical protein
MEGAFLEAFYSTTNQRTELRLDGKWIPVADQEMDCGIVVDAAAGTARCLPMNEVRLGELVVVGHAGVRVFPEERARGPQTFEFMGSTVSTEKPKGVAIREIARELAENHAGGGRTLLVGGPAIVHTGSGEFLCHLIRQGYIDVLLAGNALAAQKLMREKIRGVTFCLMIATTLHPIAVGNLLPSWVPVVCVDVNPSTTIKLSDQGTFQTVGLVTDVEPFLRALVQELETIRQVVSGR